MIRALAISAFILSGVGAAADTAQTQPQVMEAPEDFGGFETEAAQNISINATYIVVGIFLAFRLVDVIND